MKKATRAAALKGQNDYRNSSNNPELWWSRNITFLFTKLSSQIDENEITGFTRIREKIKLVCRGELNQLWWLPNRQGDLNKRGRIE